MYKIHKKVITAGPGDTVIIAFAASHNVPPTKFVGPMDFEESRKYLAMFATDFKADVNSRFFCKGLTVYIYPVETDAYLLRIRDTGKKPVRFSDPVSSKQLGLGL